MSRPTFDHLQQRLDELAAIERQRGLTAEESRERENLDYRRELRLRRVHDQIAAAEAKLARLKRMAMA